MSIDGSTFRFSKTWTRVPLYVFSSAPPELNLFQLRRPPSLNVRWEKYLNIRVFNTLEPSLSLKSPITPDQVLPPSRHNRQEWKPFLGSRVRTVSSFSLCWNFSSSPKPVTRINVTGHIRFLDFRVSGRSHTSRDTLIDP